MMTRVGFLKHVLLGCAVAMWYLTSAPLTFAKSQFSLQKTKPPTHHDNIKLAAVLGKDTRQKLPKKLRFLKQNIGRLRTSGRSCTAFCISNTLVMTAAHCIFGTTKSKKNFDPTFTTFRLNAVNTRSRNMSMITGRNAEDVLMNIVSGKRKAINLNRDARHDWTIFQLSKPICFGGLLLHNPSTAKIARASHENRLFIVGYHGDLNSGHGLYLSKKCQLRNRDNPRYLPPNSRRLYSPAKHFLLHTCDTFSGSSGSPVFIQTKEGPKVIAINTGGLSSRRYRKRGNKKKWFGKRKYTNIALRTGAFIKIAERLQNEILLTTKEDLKRLQIKLIEAGLNPGPADGLLGPSTKRAIKKYEKAHRMSMTGLPTQQLLTKLQAPDSVK